MAELSDLSPLAVPVLGTTPHLVRIYRANGETVETDRVDAKRTCERHPNDWKLTPWNGVTPIIPRRNPITGQEIR